MSDADGALAAALQLRGRFLYAASSRLAHDAATAGVAQELWFACRWAGTQSGGPDAPPIDYRFCQRCSHPLDVREYRVAERRAERGAERGPGQGPGRRHRRTVLCCACAHCGQANRFPTQPQLQSEVQSARSEKLAQLLRSREPAARPVDTRARAAPSKTALFLALTSKKPAAAQKPAGGYGLSLDDFLK